MAAQFQLTARRVSTPPGIFAAQLGESPSWDAEHGVLWWIDILGEALYVGQPSADGVSDFERVALLPLKGHSVGFVVHTHPSTGHKADAKAPFHAIWGSQSGLYHTHYGTDLPWHSAGSQPGLPQLDTAANAPHHRLTEFPLNIFELQDGRIYRYNDGKVAPDGSLWAGGMMERSEKFPKRDVGSGVLMQWTPNTPSSPYTVGAAQITVSNGMGWSPAHDILYHVDSPTGILRAYPYHAAPHGSPAGTPGHIVQSEGYVFWTLPAEQKERGATLDGLCVDSDGAVWVALSGIGEVVRLQAQKSASDPSLPPVVSVTGVVSVPGVRLCTSCCFGGADQTTLYITTARGTDPTAVANCKEENAGFVFAANLKGIAKGVPSAHLHLPASEKHAHH